MRSRASVGLAGVLAGAILAVLAGSGAAATAAGGRPAGAGTAPIRPIKKIGDDFVIETPHCLIKTDISSEFAQAFANQQEEGAFQYNQAWSMVHFLAQGDGGKYRAPFQQYIAYLAQGRQGSQAWETVFGNHHRGVVLEIVYEKGRGGEMILSVKETPVKPAKEPARP